jgi:hypothetical protein
MDLWPWLLLHNHDRQARATKSGTLVPSFGDGSGTGTGGTVQYREAEPFDMWMGVWSPRVYSFTSNWKEMRTLLATLERAKAQRRQDISGVTVFYFTDNTTTCFAVTSGSSTAPSLHDMVEKIKQLELELDIILEVVHLPGTTIITEGTDGLSRGIWILSLHNKPNRCELLAEIFAPVPFTPDLGKWVMNVMSFPPCTPWYHRSWDREWQPDDILDTLTIWAPPPEVASQLIYALLQLYIERPLMTAMIILLPRVLQKRWSRASRCVFECGCYPRNTLPCLQHSALTIPVVVLYIPFHVRSLQPPRMNSPPLTTLQRTYRQHAASVRGMPTAV